MSLDAGPHELFTTRARAGDAAGIALIANQAYRLNESRRGWTSEAGLVAGPFTDAAAIAALIDAPASALLVVRGRKMLDACVHVEAAGDAARIGLLAVRPGLQCNLLGRRLLAAAERCARRELGLAAVEVPVIDTREEAIAWLERRGYLASGAPRPYVAFAGGSQVPSGVAAVLMRRTLAG